MAARSALPPVVQESTPALIARILREAIADGRFPPGSQLVEQELARELNVSRGPLREAMQRLTQEGLLVGHRNRGLFVMELTEDAVRDMYLAREAVECAAVRRIVATGTGCRAAEALASAAPGTVEPGKVETNILVLDVGAAGWTAPALVAAAGEAGVLGYPTGPRHARYVWHLDVDDRMTDHAVDVLTGLLRRGPA